jgi:ATP-binding cassette subfamily C protein EexD
MSDRGIDQSQSLGSPLREILGTCRKSFWAAGFFSLFINLLLLAPSLYMLQVYDRVLTSSSESTLLMLTLITVFLFIIMGGLEWIRSQILIVTSTRLDQLLSQRVFDAVFIRSLSSGGKVANVQPLSDLLQLRQFLTGPGLFAFFDVPWLPIYLAVMFLFHAYYGVTAIFAALVLVGLAIWNEQATRDDLQEASQAAAEAANHTQRNLRNAEVIEAMGMLARIRARWQQKQAKVIQLQTRASKNGGFITALSKTFRTTIQTLILGLGAYLAIRRELSPGALVAGSILLGRALAPLDLMISTWRGFLTARESYTRLDELLAAMPDDGPPMALPPPKGAITLDQVVVIPTGATTPIIKGISLRIEPGTLLAIIGPSAAGKSTLVRAILGLYQPRSGSIRLDGAELSQWDREQLGHHIGYLPQDVELLDGTVSENIARFGAINPEKVVEAAQAADVHQMILHLPEGYETKIVGNVLSAGQRQRLGLARALYGNPRLIILDEPNSNLDQEGDAAFLKTLNGLKHAGHTVIVVTHRNNVLAHVDKILLLVEGQVAHYGTREEVFSTLQQAAARAPAGAHLRPVATGTPA